VLPIETRHRGDAGKHGTERQRGARGDEQQVQRRVRAEEFSALVRVDRPGAPGRRRRNDAAATTTPNERWYGWLGDEFVLVADDDDDDVVVLLVTAERAEFAKSHCGGGFTVALCHRQRHAAIPASAGRVTERIRRNFLETVGDYRLHGSQVKLKFCGEANGHAAVETREIHRQ